MEGVRSCASLLETCGFMRHYGRCADLCSITGDVRIYAALWEMCGCLRHYGRCADLCGITGDMRIYAALWEMCGFMRHYGRCANFCGITGDVRIYAALREIAELCGTTGDVRSCASLREMCEVMQHLWEMSGFMRQDVGIYVALWEMKFRKLCSSLILWEFLPDMLQVHENNILVCYLQGVNNWGNYPQIGIFQACFIQKVFL